MKRHYIPVTADIPGVGDERKAFVRKGIRTALAAEGVDFPCEVDVLLTNDARIHELNREQRGIDQPTDVLSFPAFDLRPGALPEPADADPGSGLVPLGDMVVSLERAAAQAKEYGHSNRRELAYLTVHSVLHLLGYDHLDEGPQKAQMRAKEEEKIKKLEAMKNDPNADQAKVEKMLEAANKEMNYHVEKITRMFNTEIGKADEYYARANKAQARVGGRGERVDIVRSRLTDQYASFEDLASENENIDIEKVAMDLMQADMIYNSALLAIGKIANYSLLDYI